MKYANVSVKFPEELDRELERFLDETGVYTNKSEFIKESVRHRLVELNDDPAIAALRAEQLLARAERSPVADDELDGRLDELRERVDESDLDDAVAAARTETADEVLDDA
jgi:Arc/MetJ-type ribon-helix-helix transcriptional regulator